MKIHPFIYSLQWIPKVPHELKDKFEQDAQQEGGGYKDFFIYELDSDGKKQRVSGRENYYPVFYAEPFE
jgi:CHASE1-domain containing sensor protein